ncbi:MAG TPA: GNAT family N-acetyltransferase [Cyclobacteriaceae bacterium]|nr:GNAT family N-acetyltransferase [Cyclobacteriaceae bacterium]HMV08568.1 GNAT family N-acetyltransferase [Cyclobacteriaceae bacterium]HMV91109.1 GNAT family N-acetyltransferase [Cyclobacteriaceae bacterium]HMX00223.1 GNAT family N-acetyltransferase [Cyclobacteriaceae bacterium]HMX49778.1 GNAT family N-acetyltransferase [Cyclobacteriaceae bacterium]
MTSNKDRYRKFCAAEAALPIFLKDWWLDAVSGDSWDVVLLQEGEQIKASWTYQRSAKYGYKLLNMPALTSGWGPWIAYPADQKYASRISYEHQVIGDLIDALPAFDYFNQRFRYELTNGLPFFWKGFTLTARYTYVLEDLSSTDKLWDNLSSSARSQVRKAEKLVTVSEANDIDDLFRLSTQVFERQKETIPYSAELMKKIYEATTQHNSGKVFVAKDSGNRVQAALFLVWDANSAYYLAGGTDSQAPGGTFSLLMWKAIQHAAAVTRQFNFEGSMLESVERFFRTFGPVQKPYLQVQKINATGLKLAKTAGFI